jgi:hypothetical protein
VEFAISVDTLRSDMSEAPAPVTADTAEIKLEAIPLEGSRTLRPLMPLRDSVRVTEAGKRVAVELGSPSRVGATEKLGMGLTVALGVGVGDGLKDGNPVALVLKNGNIEARYETVGDTQEVGLNDVEAYDERDDIRLEEGLERVFEEGAEVKVCVGHGEDDGTVETESE